MIAARILWVFAIALHPRLNYEFFNWVAVENEYHISTQKPAAIVCPVPQVSFKRCTSGVVGEPHAPLGEILTQRILTPVAWFSQPSFKRRCPLLLLLPLLPIVTQGSATSSKLPPVHDVWEATRRLRKKNVRANSSCSTTTGRSRENLWRWSICSVMLDSHIWIQSGWHRAATLSPAGVRVETKKTDSVTRAFCFYLVFPAHPCERLCFFSFSQTAFFLRVWPLKSTLYPCFISTQDETNLSFEYVFLLRV